MYSDVWNVVVRGRYESSFAQVHGSARRCVKNEPYPGVVRTNKHDVVAGRVYFDVSGIDLVHLDRFEGGYCRREMVDVVLEGDTVTRAALYVFRDKYLALLDNRDWDLEWFEREGLARFLRGYGGFSSR